MLLVNRDTTSKKIKHVVLIGVDGLGAYAFKDASIPNLKALTARGFSDKALTGAVVDYIGAKKNRTFCCAPA